MYKNILKSAIIVKQISEKITKGIDIKAKNGTQYKYINNIQSSILVISKSYISRRSIELLYSFWISGIAQNKFA